MRALIFELRPGNLEQDGLSRALRTHTAALQGRIGLPVVVESTLDERLPLPVEEVLYRIAQEALHNVVKHAGARQVRLELGRIASGVRLRVTDDGKGFDPAPGPGRPSRAGRDARPGRQDRRAVLGQERRPARARPSRSSCRTPPSRPPSVAPPPVPTRHPSATDDVGRLVVRPLSRIGVRSARIGTIGACIRTPATTGPLRVVVVDADDRVRESLAGLLCIGDRLEVVGTAGQAGPALDVIIATQP